MGREFPAALVRNVYGQENVWGMFGVSRGKFNKRLSQDATVEGVTYVAL